MSRLSDAQDRLYQTEVNGGTAKAFLEMARNRISELENELRESADIISRYETDLEYWRDEYRAARSEVQEAELEERE